jgi:hypothetical protein
LVAAPHRLWAEDSVAFAYSTHTGEKLGMLWATDGNFQQLAMTDRAHRLATIGILAPAVRLWRRDGTSDGFLDAWQGWAILVLLSLFALLGWASGWRQGRRTHARGAGVLPATMALLLAAGAVGAALVHAAWYTRQVGSWRLQWGAASWWAVAGGPVLLTLHLLILRQVLSCRNVWRYVAMVEAIAAIVVTLVVMGPIVSSRHYQLVETSTYDRGRFLTYWGWVAAGLLGPWILWLALLLVSGRRFAYLKLLRLRGAREAGPSPQSRGPRASEPDSGG